MTDFKPMTEQEKKQRLIEAGAKHERRCDPNDDNKPKTGWWQDNIFLSKDVRLAYEFLFGGC